MAQSQNKGILAPYDNWIKWMWSLPSSSPGKVLWAATLPLITLLTIVGYVLLFVGFAFLATPLGIIPAIGLLLGWAACTGYAAAFPLLFSSYLFCGTMPFKESCSTAAWVSVPLTVLLGLFFFVWAGTAFDMSETEGMQSVGRSLLVAHAITVGILTALVFVLAKLG